MSKEATARSAMKLALEALEGSTDKTLSIRAITALQEALAQERSSDEQPAPVAKPHEQKPVNEGWKLVPVEPTKDMWKAVNKLDDEMVAGSYDGKGCSIEQAWHCLLDAAPTPPARQEPAFHGFMDEERCCVNICYTPWAPGGPNNELPTAYYTSPPAQRPHECSRSHPHENMDAMCELRTEIARLTNENARLKAQPQQEPFGYLYEGTAEHTRHKTVFEKTRAERFETRWWREIGPCYTSPPAQRKPLTDEEIWREYKFLWPFHPAEEGKLASDVLMFARAIEAAHGIKENT